MRERHITFLLWMLSWFFLPTQWLFDAWFYKTTFKTNIWSLKTCSGGLFCVSIKIGKLHGHTLALYFIFSSVLKHTIQPSYSRILNGARFGFLHFHGFFRIPLRAISMADWGAILWRIYTHIFYFTNRLLEKLAPHEEPLTQCLKSPKKSYQGILI